MGISYLVVRVAWNFSCSFLYCSHEDAVHSGGGVEDGSVVLLLLLFCLGFLWVDEDEDVSIMAQLANASREHSLYCTLNSPLPSLLLLAVLVELLLLLLDLAI